MGCTLSKLRLVIESKSEEDKCIGNLHKVSLGRKLVKIGLKHKIARRVNANKIELLFEKMEHANMLVDGTKYKLPDGWRAFIPESKLYRTGIIRGADLEIEDDILHSAINEIYPNSKIQRMKKRANSSKSDSETPVYEPTKSVKVQFSTEHLPNEVFIEKFAFKVVPYIQNVRQCFKCWAFGHTKPFCKKQEPICVQCGQEHQFDSKSSACAKEPAKCINCSLNHMANDRDCRKYMELKEINTTAAYQGVSIQHARSILRADSHNRYRQEKLNYSYAGVTSGLRTGVKRRRDDDYHEASNSDNNFQQITELFSSLEKITSLIANLAEQNNMIIKQNQDILNYFLALKSPQSKKT